MIFKVSLCATGRWLVEVRGVMWCSTVPVLQMLLRGRHRILIKIASGPAPQLAISPALCQAQGTEGKETKQSVAC